MPLKGQRILAQVNYLPHGEAAGGDDVAAVLRLRSRVEQLATEIKTVHPPTAELGVCIATGPLGTPVGWPGIFKSPEKVYTEAESDLLFPISSQILCSDPLCYLPRVVGFFVCWVFLRLVTHLLTSVLAFLSHCCLHSFFSLLEGMSSVTRWQLLLTLLILSSVTGCLRSLYLCPLQAAQLRGSAVSRMLCAPLS